MSDKKQYVKEGRTCKVLKWAGRGPKPEFLPKAGTKVTASERAGREWWCINDKGPDCWIPASSLAVVPERRAKPAKKAAGIGA